MQAAEPPAQAALPCPGGTGASNRQLALIGGAACQRCDNAETVRALVAAAMGEMAVAMGWGTAIPTVLDAAAALPANKDRQHICGTRDCVYCADSSASCTPSDEGTPSDVV